MAKCAQITFSASPNLAWVLESVGGWTVGCTSHIENEEAVEYAKVAGWVSTRIHRAPIEPQGWECFEITDAGLEHLRELGGNVAHATTMRQWYWDNAAKYFVTPISKLTKECEMELKITVRAKVRGSTELSADGLRAWSISLGKEIEKALDDPATGPDLNVLEVKIERKLEGYEDLSMTSKGG